MIIDTHVHAGRLEHWDLKIFGTILEPYGTSVNVLDLDPVVTVEKMKEAGIISFKIEGRNRDARYVDTVVKIYRKALDKKFHNTFASCSETPIAF